MTKLTNASDESGYIRLQFPSYDVLKAWLTKHFGPDHYTDDVDVVDREGDNQTVARITRIDKNGMWVDYPDDGPKFLSF